MLGRILILTRDGGRARLAEITLTNARSSATVYRGILGYGAKNRLHKSGFLGLSEDLPVTISVIDTEEKIRRALPVLQEMISEGLVAMTDVEVLHHISGKWESKKMNKLNRSDNEH